MELSQDNKRHIKQVAEDTLDTLDNVGSAATAALNNATGPDASVLASVNTMTCTDAVQQLDQITREKFESLELLAREPAIARVVVADENDEHRTYYICRTTPISGIPNLASYRAPLGRIASLQIGSEFQLPNGEYIEVVERSMLKPRYYSGQWESKDTIIVGDGFGPITIESLRALIEKATEAEIDEGLLEQLLAEEKEASNILEGMRRGVITKMGLRDQPVLDQYQDEIFRLPLDRRLLILGPPGTGKTTTLIRRLGQKLDRAFLDEDEQQIIRSVGEKMGAEHTQSWLMFTPTELLKQYLKEAFAREGVPASDHHIKTWSDYRRELSRNTLGVLKTAAGGGSYILKDNLESLNPEAIDNPTEWFTEFNRWQKMSFIEELRQSTRRLSESARADISALGDNLLSITDRAVSGPLADTFISFASEVENIKSIVAAMKEETDHRIRRGLNLQLNRSKTFIDELVVLIDELQQEQDIDNEDLDEQEADDEDTKIPTTGKAKAVTFYMKAVRARARARASKRSLSKKSRNGRIIEWLGDRILDDADLIEIGQSLLIQTAGRRFVNPVHLYLKGIPRRYRTFRREMQSKSKWYRDHEFKQSDIHPLELDIVLLAILRGSNEFLIKAKITRDINKPVWSSLKQVRDLYKNQILVDEATDFSPIQIACMCAISNPDVRSFFACGDFNQRLTVWGSRTLDDMKWVLPEIEVKEVTVSYRQSRQLNELARSIIEAVGGTDQNVTLPEYVDSEGVAPSLIEKAADLETVVNWLSNRIREIEQFVGQLPSVAVFVEGEEKVQPVADALNEALSEENAQVSACPNGQVMGQDTDVRVFDVQHIKGLEFEAVFFVGVDRLAISQPQLFDKFLYVGTTRAATYLGVTCDNVLPPEISKLRPMFVQDWKTP